MPHTLGVVRWDRSNTSRVKTGPLPQVPWRTLEPADTLESRLPALIIAGFAVLMLVQLWLRM